MSIIHGSAPLWHKQFSAEYRSVIVQQKQQYQNCKCQCHIKPHYFIQFANYASLHAVLLTSHLLLLTFFVWFSSAGPVWFNVHAPSMTVSEGFTAFSWDSPAVGGSIILTVIYLGKGGGGGNGCHHDQEFKPCLHLKPTCSITWRC